MWLFLINTPEAPNTENLKCIWEPLTHLTMLDEVLGGSKNLF